MTKNKKFNNIVEAIETEKNVEFARRFKERLSRLDGFIVDFEFNMEYDGYNGEWNLLLKLRMRDTMYKYYKEKTRVLDNLYPWMKSVREFDLDEENTEVWMIFSPKIFKYNV